jgi:hypothetical protein
LGSTLQVLLLVCAVLHELLRHLLLLRALRLLDLRWFLRLPVGLRRRCPIGSGSCCGYGPGSGSACGAPRKVLGRCFEE